jgi:pimeloyl-ACP methyl ester carboxylesterase
MFDGLLRPLWERRSPETEAPVLKLFEREGTMFQYHHGARNPAGMNPDAWNMDQWGLDRPGNFAIQLELQANYHTNLALYPEWQAYLREHQPPTLVVWGRNDPLFGTANVDCLKRDLRDVEAHLLDTGHFALEEECDFIAERIRAFLGARLRPLHPMSF